MDEDIKNYLINLSNTRKRKNENDDDNNHDYHDIKKELYYYCVESLITELKQENINDFNNKSLKSYLNKIIINYTNIKKQLENKTDDLEVFLNAYITTLLKIINDIKTSITGNEFNVIKYLTEYKKQYFIPIKKRKLDKIEIDVNILDIDDDNDSSDDSSDDSSNDNDIQLSEYDHRPFSVKIKDKHLMEFIKNIKNITDMSGSTKEDTIKYFIDMKNNDKKNFLKTLSSLSSSNNIPHLFKIMKLNIDNDTKKNIISKLMAINDSGKIKKLADDIMKIPFGEYKGLNLSDLNSKENANLHSDISNFLQKLNTNMNESVYGHDEAKKQIINIMAQMIRNPVCNGNVLGLWGPPGTGKTSLIKDGIAKSMERPFVFISLGGCQDGSFLEGHSFTYEGSIYGRIAQALIESKCMNPIIYFDELDKVSNTDRGQEIINLLIHLIDPSQNNLFRDKYFYDINLDLSKVTFIFSFNEPHNINYILRDRITMIETKFLNNDMKIHIANNYLLKEICKDMGLNNNTSCNATHNNNITINNDIISDIINNYTHEGGVRKLKKHLYKIIREINYANLTKTKILDKHVKFPYTVSWDVYRELFKTIPKIIHLNVHSKDNVGMVNGLWANSLGQGGVLPIESVLIPSKELMVVKATGSLGEVIKESIEVALSVAWNKLDNNIKLQWMNKWKKTPECFHIHCPDGSTGKEGPSAGAAMTLTFYSILTNKKVKHNVAMTGEINLRGEVTEIGGLDEKLNAAKRAGAVLALVPYNNKIDLENVIKNNPSLINDKFKVTMVSNIDEVINHALI
jgi:ATP-dependent Lon protease